MKYILVAMSVVLLVLTTCSEKDIKTDKPVVSRVDLINHTDWHYWYFLKFQDKYRGLKAKLKNDTLSVQHADPETGEFNTDLNTWTVDLNDSAYVLDFVSGDTSAFKIADSSAYNLFRIRDTNVLRIWNLVLVAEPTSTDILLPDSLYDQIIEIKIAGYSVGDAIDPSLIEIQDIENYFSPPREIAKLKSNPDVELTVMGDSLILELKREAIPNSELDGVISVITAKTGEDPEYNAPDTTSFSNRVYVAESYIWRGNDEYFIRMKRSDLITDRDSYQYRKFLTEGVSLWGDWELDIQSPVIEEALRVINFDLESKPNPKSLYVE